MSGQNTMRDEFYFDAPGETFEVQRARADAAEEERDINDRALDVALVLIAKMARKIAELRARAGAAETQVAHLEQVSMEPCDACCWNMRDPFDGCYKCRVDAAEKSAQLRQEALEACYELLTAHNITRAELRAQNAILETQNAGLIHAAAECAVMRDRAIRERDEAQAELLKLSGVNDGS